MNILYFTSDEGEYLSDSLLHGLKKIYSSNVVDFPKCDRMYIGHSIPMNSFHGLGFTLYNGLIEEDQTDRNNIMKKVKANFFDLIIFSDIERQYFYFHWLYPFLDRKKTIIIDGNDFTNLFPYSGIWLRKIEYYKHLNDFSKFLYFKREWTQDTVFSLTSYFLNKLGIRFKSKLNNINKISYSFPKEKIYRGDVKKEKTFVSHIVDKDVSQKLNTSSISYKFDNENDYYKDLQISKFGITTKKGGWDCLRHYELAANKCLPCFKNLNLKPDTCAPHGLNKKNCIIYDSPDDLLRKIENISEAEYLEILNNSYDWINQNTTEIRAMEVINKWFNQNKI